MYDKAKNKLSSIFWIFSPIIWKTLKFSFNSNKYLTFLYFIFTVLLALLPFAQDYINSKVIDSIVSLVSDGLGLTPELKSLIYLYVGVYLLLSIVRSLDNMIRINLREYVYLALDKALTLKVGSLEIPYFEDPDTNDLIERAKRDVNRVWNFLAGLIRMLDALAKVLATFTLLYALDPLLIVIALVSELPQVYNQVFHGKKIWSLYREKSEDMRYYRTTRNYLTSPSSLAEIRLYGLHKFIFDKAYEAYARYWIPWIKIRNKREYFSMAVSLVSVVGIALGFFILIDKTLSGIITIGLLTFYVSMSRSFSSGMARFMLELTTAYEQGLYVRGFFETLDLQNKMKNGTKVLDASSDVPKIEFKNVSFSYPNTDKLVLNNINLVLNPGDHIAIVGENGAGKTTLIKLLLRFYDVTSGEILLNGVNIKDIDLDTWYKHVATLFQKYNFYHFTVQENISVGDISVPFDNDHLIDSAKKSGAHEFISTYDNKYDQIMSKAFKGGIDPSEGQKQKIALARAFYSNSSVLIMDEPTSAIDPKAEYEIFEELLKFAKGKTVVIISHRFSTVRNADRILVLGNGEIIEDGSHEDLMKIEQGVYKHAFDLQKRGYE